MRRTQHRSHPERGSALVEFAFAFPLFVLLMLTLIDFGSYYSSRIQIRNGTREAARTAVVGKVGTDNSCTVEGSGFGLADQRFVCLTKTRLHTVDSDRSRVKVMFLAPDESITTSYTNVNNSLVVCTMTLGQSISGILSSILDHRVERARTIMQIERLASPYPLQPQEEAPLDGQNWDFCSEGL